jgi:hypothetical protein
VIRFVLIMAATAPLLATDPFCPRYPEVQRHQDQESLQRERVFALSRYKSSAVGRRAAIERRNLVDEAIFSKMETAGIEPAPLATDAEFLRRIFLDLTGRIPNIERAEAFLASSDGNKRTQLIEELLKSDEYVERWALFYRDLFEITALRRNL